MGITDLTSFEDLVDACLTRANEETDGTSDWDSEARMAVIAAHRRLVNKFPWVSLEKYPPGRLLTTAAITTLTLTVAAAGTSVAVTLSAVPAQTITNWMIVPRGKDYAMRVTAGGATATPTVDVAPEAIASALACDIYQDEYDLASDFNLFVNGLWTRDNDLIPVLDDERVRLATGVPAPQGWPVKCAALIGRQKIRLSGWDTSRHPVEYPYTYDPGDPSGTSAMTIESRLRSLLAEMALPTVLDLKRGFTEAQKQRVLVEAPGGLLEEAMGVDQRRRRGGDFGRTQREQSDNNPW